MKVNVNFTIEFDRKEFEKAFAIPGEKMTSEDIRDQIKAASTNALYELIDNGVEAKLIKY